jgi:GNAT superfamily N-acetyltransferase
MLAEPYCIRRAEQDDVPGIVRLARSFLAVSGFGRWFTLTQEGVEHAVAVLLSWESGVGFVVEREGRIVGAIVGHRCHVWFEPNATIAAELGWWVDPAHRGVGVSLLRAFEAWGREQKADVVALSDLLQTNASPAGELLEKLGYEMVERSFVRGL